MLEIRHISKTFNPGTVNEKTALNDLSLTLADGDFATIVGSNGAGKSTLLMPSPGTSFWTKAVFFWRGMTLPTCRLTGAAAASAVSSRTPCGGPLPT